MTSKLFDQRRDVVGPRPELGVDHGLTARDPRAPFALAEPVLPLGRRGRRVDWWLAAVAFALSLIGALLVWAATRDQLQAQGGSGNHFLYRHLINIGVAVVLSVLAARLDARLLRLFGPVVYAVSLLGLMLVLAVGATINGAHAWINLGGGFQLQPSEFMKLGLIVGLAVLFTERAARRDDDGPPTGSDVVLAVGLLIVPLGLIMAQPDLGSAMVLAAAAFGVFLGARVRARWTLGLAAAGAGVAVLALKVGLLAEYQLSRFASFADPTQDVQGAAYNVTQAHIAIANGGLFGTGLFQGPQTNGGFVPEQQTDFVFSVAGEEFGLVGGAVIIALFALLCWRGLRIARLAQQVGDDAGRLVAIGVVCWFAVQVFENIGMNLGLTPVTGLPLPFVSYGGSSMFAEALAIGLLEAVHRRVAAEQP